MHESRKPLIWYRASVQTGTQASPAVGIVSRQEPTIHHQIQAATREMLVLTFSPFRNWQIESTLNSLRRPHSLLQTGRKSQLAVCAHGKTSPYPTGQVCSFMRARIAKGAQKHILEGISVPSMRATFIFLYWWDVTSGIFCKTSSEIITKDWIQACFCKEGQNKPSCTDNKCQRQWKHFSFRERRQKKTTTTKKVPLTSIVALATGEFENTNTHKYSPDSSALGFKILQTGREHTSCVRYHVSNQKMNRTGMLRPPHTLQSFNKL